MNSEEKHKFQFTWQEKNIDYIVVPILIFAGAYMLAYYFEYKWNQSLLGQRTMLFFFTGLFVYLIRPQAKIHHIRMDQLKKVHKLMIGFIITVTCMVAFCTMKVSDFWSDGGPDYQFQYEEMTEAILDGHLYLDLEISPELAAMDNPYDSGARGSQGVSFYWDHAFYNGHYYMYFGVVPVLLIMLPFRLIGISLYSYQATQIFVVCIILGMFCLFRQIVRRMCSEMPLSAFLSIAVATSWVTIWYGVKYPAMYCTANTGGICLAVWGFYFCYRAFIIDTDTKKTMLHGLIGGVCSALTFGCRPTIGLFCLILLPMLWAYFKKCRNRMEFLKSFLVFCIPFIVVAILLMTYNYARFDSPFEFGQSYQLTTVDQHDYSSNEIKISKIISGIYYHFFYYEDVSDTFPFIHHDGNLVTFPVLLIAFISFGMANVRDKGQTMVKGLPIMTVISVGIIMSYHVIWAPIVFRRYSMDFIFMLCFLVMFGSCGMFWNKVNHAGISFWLTVLAAYTCVICFLLYFVAYDYSIADRQGEILEQVRRLVIFWKPL